MAPAQMGRLTGENAVSLVVYDGLPQDSIVDIDVAAVIQSTRQGVGKQIADMVRQLINGDDIDTLQVLWQPEFSRARRPNHTKNSKPDHRSETFWFVSETFRIKTQDIPMTGDVRCKMPFFDLKAIRLTWC